MDETDGILIGLCIAGVAVAVLMLARAVRDVQEDVEIIRLTATAPMRER